MESIKLNPSAAVLPCLPKSQYPSWHDGLAPPSVGGSPASSVRYDTASSSVSPTNPRGVKPVTMGMSQVSVAKGAYGDQDLDNWVHAANACPKPCPTGTDVECTNQLGDEYACFFFTGCYERYQSGEFGPLETDEPEVIEEGKELVEQETVMTVIEATLSLNTNQYCASTWIQAMINCGGVDEEKACPNGDRDCDKNEMCQKDTNVITTSWTSKVRYNSL
ncbi:hypothetical protein THAOC_37357 [Thalassiosira oceanica]|uniref:Uncharacterized protein n=1 Tax=Thalassiosira oceanica TaxID=159749 RepID=K0RCA2_THAOC|nr:hypothetical protein THAOC_37357 [Thalassiosira oceanica]|eukprot:EJK44132.1 hypothetical protein THAOC_37357 [Thalassiosira oceanica]